MAISVHPEQGTAFSENIYFTVEGKEGTTFFVYADNYTQEKLRFCEKSVGGKRISSHAPRLSFIRAYLLNYIRSFGSQKFSVNHSPSNLPRERFRKSVVDPPPISFRMRICAQGDTHPCNRHAISITIRLVAMGFRNTRNTWRRSFDPRTTSWKLNNAWWQTVTS